MWNRNTVLAEAFCLSDEHVRSAQSALDETQAQRSRLLAAFAVTIGSDSAVSDLLGLSEREVRVARRTVGKEDARRMADDVLATATVAEAAENMAAQAAPDNGHATPHPGPHTGHAPHTGHTAPPVQPQQQTAAAPPPPAHTPQHHTQAQHQPAYQQYAHQATSHLDAQAPASYESPMTSTAEIPVVRETAWTSAMDLVLIDSWQSGIDLRVLADEFGLDLARLVTRVQQLSAEGRLTAAQPSVGTDDRSGRHRRDSSGASGGSYTNVSSGGSYANGGYSNGSYGNGSYGNGSYANGSYGTGSYSTGSGGGSYSTGSSGGSYSTGSYDSYGNGVTPSGWEAPSTIPEDMVANYLPPQHTWPNYMAGSTVR
ncbi:hypothetical protein [Streptomyces sp. NPDC048639]|uniref:hypothetical protein n=1 Tax=Streptomyces sp. NPDC048639 TaxID=3365581 RepID=UPI0037147B46